MRLAHAGEVRRNEAHVRPAAALEHQRLEPAQPGRPVEHGDRHVHGRVLRSDFEAAHVRRKEKQRLALRVRGERQIDAVDLAHHRSDLGVRAEPERRQLGEHLARGGDRLAAHARIGVTGLLEIGAQVAPVGGRYPIDGPPEDASQRVQQRQRQFPGEAQDDAGEPGQGFGILAASHKKAARNERFSVYF